MYIIRNTELKGLYGLHSDIKALITYYYTFYVTILSSKSFEKKLGKTYKNVYMYTYNTDI